MLSIIVLNYNRLELSKQTIERILSITQLPFELLLVDNNSHPKSGVREYLYSVANKHGNDKVKLVFCKQNFGVAGGRNEGLLRAKGDYLITIDDDIWLPDNYDKLLVDACDNIPDIGLVGISVETHLYPLVKINGVVVQRKGGNLGGGCLCMSRKIFEKIGYYNSSFVYGFEDCEMYLRTKYLKLISVYIEPRGKHLDLHENKSYLSAKKLAHEKDTRHAKMLGKLEYRFKRGENLYVPYKKTKVHSKLMDVHFISEFEK